MKITNRKNKSLNKKKHTIKYRRNKTSKNIGRKKSSNRFLLKGGK